MKRVAPACVFSLSYMNMALMNLTDHSLISTQLPVTLQHILTHDHLPYILPIDSLAR